MLEVYVDYFMDPRSSRINDFHVLRIGRGEGLEETGLGPTLFPYHMICVIEKGRGLFHVDGITQNLNAGDAFIVPAEKLCYARSDPDTPWSFYWIDFTGTRADQVMSQLRFTSKDQLVFRGLPVEDYESVFHRGIMLSGSRNSNYFFAIGVLMDVLGLIARDIDMKDKDMDNTIYSLVYEIRHYIDMQYTKKLRVQEIADKYGVHPNYMSRLFKQTFGVTPKQYLQTLKLTKACDLLAQTDLPVSMVSASMSYPDQLAFSKAFHKAYGISPTEYRRQQQKQLQKQQGR